MSYIFERVNSYFHLDMWKQVGSILPLEYLCGTPKRFWSNENNSKRSETLFKPTRYAQNYSVMTCTTVIPYVANNLNDIYLSIFLLWIFIEILSKSGGLFLVFIQTVQR